MSVLRCYVEKRPGFDVEAMGLLRQLREQLGLTVLMGLRILNRYDVEGISPAAWLAARETVFSEPQCDAFYEEDLPDFGGLHRLLLVEPLPGQYDQRGDSCAQCIQLLAGGERPRVTTAKVYVLMGALEPADLLKIKRYLMNPVETREAAPEKPQTLAQAGTAPAKIKILSEFTALDEAGLTRLLTEYGLAMDLADLQFMQAEFKALGRDPSVTELKLVDTYWSDHCRHTTFGTHIDSAEIGDPEVRAAYGIYLAAREEVYGPEKAAARPQTLMDIATIGTKLLKKRGELQKLDESEEINACSVHCDVNVDGKLQDWLLMFKNET
ncbi:MAG: phosphoribosylformylglycinamidine synthase, partial [Pseudoflavonifractor sp.]